MSVTFEEWISRYGRVRNIDIAYDMPIGSPGSMNYEYEMRGVRDDIDKHLDRHFDKMLEEHNKLKTESV